MWLAKFWYNNVVAGITPIERESCDGIVYSGMRLKNLFIAHG